MQVFQISICFIITDSIFRHSRIDFGCLGILKVFFGFLVHEVMLFGIFLSPSDFLIQLSRYQAQMKTIVSNYILTSIKKFGIIIYPRAQFQMPLTLKPFNLASRKQVLLFFILIYHIYLFSMNELRNNQPFLCVCLCVCV